MATVLPTSTKAAKQALYTQRVEADESIPPNQTLYIKNLNDRVKLDVLKGDLQDLFSKYGTILDIVAMSSFWRKGQAWIIYNDIESAKKAMEELQGHMYHGHAMHINFALEKSDLISKADGTFKEREKGPKKPRAIKEREEKQRLLFKEMQRDFITGNLDGMAHAIPHQDGVSQFNPETAKALAAAQARAAELALASKRAIQSAKGANAQRRGGFSAPVIPNRTLFVESLPEGVTTNDVISLFCRMPGYIEARVIPARKVAFVDFDNDMNSGYAMQTLQGQTINGTMISISYAKH
ncbi:U1 snRNP protein, putative [Theileria equi strain WA]|uniref:U1 snRNP protein, putative n=1 Tax=Theileria equi strain WA TaxID=1537102 RepID=L1L9T6_THEEQ|nr:U1 snRNP protein, putative [Theileria equi strain WA]EKX72009.1 U1 snRNP protein, putative [Theileria equi strain WA]|eukprot:XP_004831461.1 U1 snRNP protein, putative [Theileria equi strain WA]